MAQEGKQDQRAWARSGLNSRRRPSQEVGCLSAQPCAVEPRQQWALKAPRKCLPELGVVMSRTPGLGLSPVCIRVTRDGPGSRNGNNKVEERWRHCPPAPSSPPGAPLLPHGLCPVRVLHLPTSATVLVSLPSNHTSDPGHCCSDWTGPEGQGSLTAVVACLVPGACDQECRLSLFPSTSGGAPFGYLVQLISAKRERAVEARVGCRQGLRECSSPPPPVLDKGPPRTRRGSGRRAVWSLAPTLQGSGWEPGGPCGSRCGGHTVHTQAHRRPPAYVAQTTAYLCLPLPAPHMKPQGLLFFVFLAFFSSYPDQIDD